MNRIFTFLGAAGLFISSLPPPEFYTKAPVLEVKQDTLKDVRDSFIITTINEIESKKADGNAEYRRKMLSIQVQSLSPKGALEKVTPVKKTSMFDVVVWHIKYHEGFRPKPYICSAGYKTVGYGFVIEGVKWGIDSLDERSASFLLHEALERKLKWVKETWMPTKDGWAREEQLALAMLAYNCRMNTFSKSSLWKEIRKYKQGEGNKKDLKRAWMKWSYYKDAETGKRVQGSGLKKRREFEYQLFVGGQKFVDDVREETRGRLLDKLRRRGVIK